MHILHHFRVAKNLATATGAHFVVELIGGFGAADCTAACQSNDRYVACRVY